MALEDWRARALAAENEAAEAKKELEDFQESSALLEKELEQENKQLEQKLKDEKTKRARLEQELDKIKERTANTSDMSRTQISSLEAELQQLRADNKKMSAAMRTLEQRNDELEESARRAASGLDNIQVQVNSALEENEFLKTEVEEKSQNEQHLQEEKKELQAALDMAQAQLERTRNQLTSIKPHQDASEELQIVQALLEEQNTINAQQQEQLQALEAKAAQHSEDLARVRTELAEALAAKDRAFETDRVLLQAQLDEALHHAASNTAAPAPAPAGDSDTATTQLKEQLASLQAQLKEAMEQASVAKDKLGEEAAAKNRLVEEHNTELAALSVKLNEALQPSAASAPSLFDLQQVAAAKDATITQYTAQLQLLRAEFDETKRQLAAAGAAAAEATGRLGGEVAAKEQTIVQLKTEVTVLQARLEETQRMANAAAATKMPSQPPPSTPAANRSTLNVTPLSPLPNTPLSTRVPITPYRSPDGGSFNGSFSPSGVPRSAALSMVSELLHRVTLLETKLSRRVGAAHTPRPQATPI